VTSAFAAIADSFSSTATAQELMTFDQLLSSQKPPAPNSSDLPVPSESLTPEQQQSVDEAVTEAFRATVQESNTPNLASDSLRKLSPGDISNFNAAVQSRTGVSILPEHWQYIETKKDASEYLKSMKALEKKYPGVFTGKSSNWSVIQEDFQAQTGQTLVVRPKKF
jgi:hypothetical protein